jgi:hypothetical protein
LAQPDRRRPDAISAPSVAGLEEISDDEARTLTDDET